MAERKDDPRAAGLGGMETETVAGASGALPGSAVLFDRGALVGRYVVLHVVGQGGMGVVYAAWDPELDRKVALKLVRPDRAGSDPHRTLHEAQAIARLSHPNVIAVYDAGHVGDQVFLAMELVEGRTLREWLAESPRRPWREVLDVFLLAGRGLAAAHAAGLVHGDFKPENVLLGEDSRVRVADFGLARPAEAEAAEPGGAVSGTPAYMAPELPRGSRSDARSDQYSFCVALWEALHGERPSPGGGEVPPGVRVPAWVRQALARGLQPDPAGRFASMDELLRELGRDPGAARRRRLAAVAGLALVAAAAVAGQRALEARKNLCSGGEAQISGVWNEAAKRAGRQAYLASALPFAAGAWQAVESALDRYTRSWAVQHRGACEATRVRGEQSEDLLDRRMVCLDQRLQQLEALARLLSRADEPMVRRAGRVAEALGDLSECSNTVALLERVPPPADAGQRARVQEARARLAEAQALDAAGRFPAAISVATQVERQSATLAYAPLRAEALYTMGDLREKTGDFAGSERLLYQAIWEAERARDDLLRTKCWRKLIYTVGYRLGRFEEGHRLARHAEAALVRAGRPRSLESALLNSEASLFYLEERYPEALATFQRSLDLHGEPGTPRLFVTLSNLGNLYQVTGDAAQAVAYQRRALAIGERELGGMHPDLASLRLNLGLALVDLGNKREAEGYLRRSLADREQLLGPDHPDVAESLEALGGILNDTGRAAEALAMQRRAVAIFEAKMPGHGLTALCRGSLGETLRVLGRHEEALAEIRASLRGVEAFFGPEHVYASLPLQALGALLVDSGRPAEALPPLERALAIRERQPVPRGWLDESRFALARALWESGGDRARALRLARQAAAGFAALGEAEKTNHAEVEAWLAARGDRT